MFVGVVALHYQHRATECYNSHKHSQSPLTTEHLNNIITAYQQYVHSPGATMISYFLLRNLKKVRSFWGSISRTTPLALWAKECTVLAYVIVVELSNVVLIGIPKKITTIDYNRRKYILYPLKQNLKKYMYLLFKSVYAGKDFDAEIE